MTRSHHISNDRSSSRRRRVLGVVVAVVVLLASACSGGDDGALEPVAFTAEKQGSEADQTLRDERPAETTVPPVVDTTTTTTTTKVPLGDNETWVAVATSAIDGRVELYDAPNGTPVTFEFGVYNPTFWDTPLALRIVEGVGSDEWVKVALPVRPNHSEAWIRTDGFDTFSHSVHAEVTLSSRTVRVFDGDEVIAETESVIGKEATPTPLGDFYVNEILPRANPAGAFGPYILSLSAFSETLDTFGGGLPVIAIHGTNSPGLIGGAHSNGCIRIPNDVVTFLAENVPLGTPVRISS